MSRPTEEYKYTDNYVCGYEQGKVDGYDQGRIDTLDELKRQKDEIIRWLIKRDKEGYGTTNGELLDHIYDIANKLKG